MRALVTGAAGQDGTLLCALLAERGHEVVGLGRNASSGSPAAHVRMLRCDVTQADLIDSVVSDFQPEMIFHLAAAHHSSEETGSVALDQAMVATNFHALEIIVAAIMKRQPSCRVFMAGSSQMYQPTGGRTVVDETTPMRPSSFYGFTKSWARQLIEHYRTQRGVHAGMGILFNHESPLRAPKFVTRKITMAAAWAALGEPPNLHLRDIASESDWSSALDVVEGMLLAASAPEPGDFVFASGVAHRVEDVLEAAFGAVDLNWREFTTFDIPPGQRRGCLVGKATRARERLGWSPKIGFREMIAGMVRSDLELLRTTGVSVPRAVSAS